MFLPIVFLLSGLGVLILGAEGLVKGSASLAKRSGVPPIVIGLTIVAFGTSAPELVVNIMSALKGTADIAIGNVVGSNICNILLILGVSSIIRPFAVKKNTTWKEIPFALLAMILVYTMGNDMFFDKNPFNALTRTDGFSLIAMFGIFMFYAFSLAKKEGNAEEVKVYPWAHSIIFIFFGLGALVFGGKILVDNAVVLAKMAGISEALIGLTIVAVGTSLPELATSVIATIHGHDDIAVGNIVGSNIFNVFWVLGLTATLLQLPFNPATNIDILVGFGATLLLFIAMFVGNKHRIDRWQGILFLSLYVFYIVYLVIRG